MPPPLQFGKEVIQQLQKFPPKAKPPSWQPPRLKLDEALCMSPQTRRSVWALLRCVALVVGVTIPYDILVHTLQYGINVGACMRRGVGLLYVSCRPSTLPEFDLLGLDSGYVGG